MHVSLKHHVGMCSEIKTVEFKAEDFPSKGKKTSMKSKTNVGKKIVTWYTGNQLQTYHKCSAINRLKKLECTVNEQSAKSLGFCYRRLKYGPVKTEN